MWDTVDTSSTRLSHDMPCTRCGHGRHPYLACSDTCSCHPDASGGDDSPTLLSA